MLHEHETHSGRVMFISNDSEYKWLETDRTALMLLSKIIGTYLNVARTRSASRAKSSFLSRVSHEIRTPMNAIIGMTNIAADAYASGNKERVNDCLQKIDTSANFLLSLINDVLEMSRIESGNLLEIHNRPFSLSGFVHGIEAIIRFSIESNKVTFNIVSEFEDSIVIGDAYRIKQVIINLLGNANKFTPPGGTITFSIKKIDTTHYKFSVKDTGVGIPQEKHATIFNPFVQADSAWTNQKGTGLGLSISRNIINAMGSKIELYSEVGNGAEFSFVLDLRPAVQKKSGLMPEGFAVGAEPDYMSRFNGKTILVVDDVEINVEIALFILESSGFIVETARNGKEAVEKFNASPNGYYNAILMDIQMPLMDGIAATRAIRSNDERSDAKTVPIIALTANAFDDDLKKSVESGMNDHIIKPINNEKLLRLLYELLK